MGWLVQLLSGGIASKISNTAVNAVSLAALVPLAMWFLKSKDDILVTFTYSQSAVVGLLLFAFLKLAHYTKP